MSDTPRTDAQGYGDGRHPYVPTDFARQLERELAQMTAQRDRLAEALESVLDEIGDAYLACESEVKEALAAVKGATP